MGQGAPASRTPSRRRSKAERPADCSRNGSDDCNGNCCNCKSQNRTAAEVHNRRTATAERLERKTARAQNCYSRKTAPAVVRFDAPGSALCDAPKIRGNCSNGSSHLKIAALKDAPTIAENCNDESSHLKNSGRETRRSASRPDHRPLLFGRRCLAAVHVLRSSSSALTPLSPRPCCSAVLPFSGSAVLR